MGPGEFLRAVWPDDGYYCLAVLKKTVNDPSKSYFKNIVFDSIDHAADFAVRNTSVDLYFAVFSLEAREVWDPTKKNFRTGKLGAMTQRKHSNMLACKAWFLDLDCGPGKDYPDQKAALRALAEFAKPLGLPQPWVVSSGRGVHVYWVVDRALPQAEWLPTAAALKKLADARGFHYDKSRITDVSSVLRVAGTFNFKDPEQPLAVKVLRTSPVIAAETFQRLIADAAVRDGTPISPVTPRHSATMFGPSNLTTAYDGPSPTLKEVGAACGQVRRLITTIKAGEDIPNPAWYQGLLGTVKWVENGPDWCRQLTLLTPRTNSDVDDKLAQLDAFAPTSCVKLAEVMPWGDEPCRSCVFRADPQVPNPLMAARRGTAAPAPEVQHLVAGEVTTTTIPDPPAPYKRMKSGGVTRTYKDGDGNELTEVIYQHDLYPVRRLVNVAGYEQQEWRAELPRSGSQTVMLDAPALYDGRKFTEALANSGIYPPKANIPYLQDYMVAYISRLQQEADADEQLNHLGWTDDYKGFILPDRVLKADGTVGAATLAIGTERAAAAVKQKGEIAAQVQLLRFFNDRRYVAHQFFVVLGLAAPAYHMTGHHGIVVNASGPAGASKTTALATAAALWGDPELYPINGTNSGATMRGRNERVTTLANLPICVDEITNLAIKDAQDLAMGITQPGHRIRLHTDGTERKSLGGHKSTIMLTTANSSLHGLLASDNSAGTAGSMRVFEIDFRLPGVHHKYQADEYLRDIREHFGHVGPAWAAYLTQNREAVSKRIHAKMVEVDRRGQIQASERFWSATIATAIVVLEFANELGLLPYDPVYMYNWLIDYQLPAMRGVVLEEYTTPLAMLADYVTQVHANILFVQRIQGAQGRVESHVSRRPMGAVLGHYDIANQALYLLKKGFADYCRKHGANATKLLNELAEVHPDANGTLSRVVTDIHSRMTLGAHTEYATAQCNCFVVNMAHPEVVDGPHPLTIYQPAPLASTGT